MPTLRSGSAFDIKMGEVRKSKRLMNGQAPWATAKTEDMTVKGQLWPLKVGNVVHYPWKASRPAGCGIAP